LTPSPPPPFIPEEQPWDTSGWGPSPFEDSSDEFESSDSYSPSSSSIIAHASSELDALEGFEHLKTFEVPRYESDLSFVGEVVIAGKYSLFNDLLAFSHPLPSSLC
jgi:hypothetical protein